jgi:hypothetical protein
MSRRSVLAMVVLAAPLATAWADAGRAATALRAGAARRDITPREPVPMWGYGERHARPSEGVLDPLQATALVLQAGPQKLAIVGLDLGRSPAEESLQRIRDRIRQEAGIAHSLIAGSHTHHGPVVELTDRPGRGQGAFDAALRYNRELEDAIVAAIVEADRQLAEAALAVGSVELERFNRNRHSKLAPAPVDRSLRVMRLDHATTGERIAALVNFTAHPTSIPAEQLRFSADYAGALRETIEAELGGLALFMQGAAGDLSTDRKLHGDHAAYGRALGREAAQLLATLRPAPVADATLQVREERFSFASRTNFNNPLVRTVYAAAFFPELVANFLDEYAHGIRPRVTVAVLNGNLALVGGSGEFFCQHALRLRERARVEQLFFFGYCNGYHQYFPTIEGAAEGGYGADAEVAPASVGAGETMMNAALAWIYQLQGKLD